jgi:hypothetical protein
VSQELVAIFSAAFNEVFGQNTFAQLPVKECLLGIGNGGHPLTGRVD